MRRKFTMVAAAGALALGLAACGGGGAGAGGGSTEGAGGGADPSDITIGVAMPTETSERWIADGKAVKQGLEDLGYKVNLQYAGDDIPTQTQQIDQMITSGADVLIIASIDGTALTSQLESAAAQNIPVIAYDRLIRDSENVDFYVTFDNFAVGVAQGTALLQGMGLIDASGVAVQGVQGPLNIELFAGSPDDNNAGFFFDGAMSVLQPYIDNGTLVVKSGQTDFDTVATLRWSQEAAQKRMEDLLTSTYSDGSTLSGVLSPFDGISRGIITALQGVGQGPTIEAGLPIVTGQDAEIASVKLINDGVQSSTIFKDTRKLADQSVKVAEAFVKGEKPEANDTETYDNGKKVVPSYLLTVDTVFAEDIVPLLVDSGYWTEAQVQSGVA
ncbi:MULTISPECIES: multiple monosaccharide ABC transporter substrate-binding protein [Cellulomonas]|jgi:putative multiple sugar transport system substrate-binding protein|uniref:Multiple sugar transport system substrate-binding protein n=1 Tax=Cellulomonas iranensis TaxID=76862 RepID=A0ABU0GMS5_9CELL|nr:MULTISPECIES: multiple monosaccharide ABC transporter substrate-binding protein [Cellulomonas]MBO9568118.1 sugar-binding protein [Cellulomonas iranensis]MDQ0426353.1 putative multiple sugar transport system substrate-binding protein [Cellulomonas iranensis]TFH74028.1 sugar ABC transporter substrate-binding protein [Cellulomonas sp. HD19AZ1]UCN15758.1 sugar-binding protein [Cellulomonas iranensis]